MQAEIEKLTGLSGGAPDWNLVIAHAGTVLSAKSKDLLAACYLCAALLIANGRQSSRNFPVSVGNHANCGRRGPRLVANASAVVELPKELLRVFSVERPYDASLESV